MHKTYAVFFFLTKTAAGFNLGKTHRAMPEQVQLGNLASNGLVQHTHPIPRPRWVSKEELECDSRQFDTRKLPERGP